jgi:hypothetical protein
MNGILSRQQIHILRHEPSINVPTRASQPDVPYTFANLSSYVHHEASPFGFNGSFKHH